MFARCVQIIAGNEMAERGRVGGEYRLRNSASSRFYRFTWTRTMGELLASHKCAQLPLFFSLSLSLDFNFFFFYSARHEEEYIILAYITACAKETAKLSRQSERIYSPLEGAIRNRTACISMNAFDQLPFILHQSSFASLLSILDSGDFNPSSYHSLVSS